MTVGYPSPTPVLPTLNGFSVEKKPTWNPIVVQAVSGKETQFIRQAYPVWEFNLTYEALRDQTQNQSVYAHYAGYMEFQQICQVFLANSGQFGRFFYSDPTDCSRTGQSLGTGDGVTTTFRIKRTWGHGALVMAEPVGGLNADQPFVVYLNGVATTAFTLSSLQSIIFTTAPAAGVAITMDFFFYYFCRFLEDMVDFDQFYTNLWALKSFKFRSVKN